MRILIAVVLLSQLAACTSLQCGTNSLVQTHEQYRQCMIQDGKFDMVDDSSQGSPDPRTDKNAIPALRRACDKKTASACSDLGIALENQKQPSESLGAFGEGCRLNYGEACAHLAEYAQRLHQEKIVLNATPIAAYWLNEECTAAGGGDSCATQEWFAERCDASILACKNLQLALLRRDRRLQQQDRQREVAAQQAQMQAIAAGLQAFSNSFNTGVNCTSNKYGSTTYTNCH